MASALCRSKSLSNIFVRKVIALDIADVKSLDENRNSEWAYVISVAWSDTRENKIFRSYKELSDLYNVVYKLCYSNKYQKSKSYPDLPKVPGRWFFDWNMIKLMIKNQSKIEQFLNVLLALPAEISRQERVLDFFETRNTDVQYNQLRSSASNTTPRVASQIEVETISSKFNGTDVYAESLSSTSSPSIELERVQTKRPHTPPNYLPVTSCFEPDDLMSNGSNGYQMLLEDITPFDLYEDYETLYSFPLMQLNNLRQKLSNDISDCQHRTAFYNEEWWIKECEEIISPYSPNKAYFRLVQDFEVF